MTDGAESEEETQKALVVIHSIVLYVGKRSTNCPKLSNVKGLRDWQLDFRPVMWFWSASSLQYSLCG